MSEDYEEDAFEDEDEEEENYEDDEFEETGTIKLDTTKFKSPAEGHKTIQTVARESVETFGSLKRYI